MGARRDLLLVPGGGGQARPQLSFPWPKGRVTDGMKRDSTARKGQSRALDQGPKAWVLHPRLQVGLSCPICKMDRLFQGLL